MRLWIATGRDAPFSFCFGVRSWAHASARISFRRASSRRIKTGPVRNYMSLFLGLGPNYRVKRVEDFLSRRFACKRGRVWGNEIITLFPAKRFPADRRFDSRRTGNAEIGTHVTCNPSARELISRRDRAGGPAQPLSERGASVSRILRQAAELDTSNFRTKHG